MQEGRGWEMKCAWKSYKETYNLQMPPKKSVRGEQQNTGDVKGAKECIGG